MASATIGMRYRACTSAFERLRVDLEEGHLGECHVAPLPAVQHEFGRFQIWAGDAGVTGTGRESLEHRLRDYEDVHDAIVDLLDDLHSQLVKCLCFFLPKIQGEHIKINALPSHKALF